MSWTKLFRRVSYEMSECEMSRKPEWVCASTLPRKTRVFDKSNGVAASRLAAAAPSAAKAGLELEHECPKARGGRQPCARGTRPTPDRWNARPGHEGQAQRELPVRRDGAHEARAAPRGRGIAPEIARRHAPGQAFDRTRKALRLQSRHQAHGGNHQRARHNKCHS